MEKDAPGSPTPGYPPAEACRCCRGECCRHCAGFAHPDDLAKPLIQTTRELLATGEWALDWWEGDINGDELERIPMLRPRHTNGGVVDGSWGGTCVFLTESGCQRTFAERPRQCRLMKPEDSLKCKTDGKEPYARAWRPYAAELEKLIAECN